MWIEEVLIRIEEVPIGSSQSIPVIMGSRLAKISMHGPIDIQRCSQATNVTTILASCVFLNSYNRTTSDDEKVHDLASGRLLNLVALFTA